MEGSLNRVVAYAKLLRTVVTPELAGEALQDISSRQPKALPSPTLLLDTIASYFNLDVQDLKSPKRDKQTSFARHIAMYLMREQTDFSLSRIGRELGGRQAIIVSQSHKKISLDMVSDPAIKQMINDIQQKIAPK